MRTRIAPQKKSQKQKKRGRTRRKGKDKWTIQQMTEAIGSSNGELDDIFPAWSRYLRDRRRVPPIGKLVGDAKGYLCWGLQIGHPGAAPRCCWIA